MLCRWAGLLHRRYWGGRRRIRLPQPKRVYDMTMVTTAERMYERGGAGAAALNLGTGVSDRTGQAPPPAASAVVPPVGLTEHGADDKKPRRGSGVRPRTRRLSYRGVRLSLDSCSKRSTSSLARGRTSRAHRHAPSQLHPGLPSMVPLTIRLDLPGQPPINIADEGGARTLWRLDRTPQTESQKCRRPVGQCRRLRPAEEK